ncbi:hypothetical protein [Agarivorans litoreus]|uniref:hypothetical protein n=1 Tax=Agarivorans litoreus TaxID=1510455 RepID=UPI001C7E1860|nr:hypothetical protein [Agarivorans litoreus]
MTRKRVTKVKKCVGCKKEFKTTSLAFTSCVICRKAKNNSRLVSNFIGSNYGRWLVGRIADHKTFKVMEFSLKGLQGLYDIYRLRKKYCQYTYDGRWSQKYELDLCHLYPIKGDEGFVGEFSPRNLLIAPSRINKAFKNKVFDAGYKVKLPPPSKRISGVNEVKNSIKRNKRFRGAVLEFQKIHKLKPPKKEDIEGVIKPSQDFTLEDIVRNESLRLGVRIPTEASVETKFTTIIKGVVDKPAKSVKPVAYDAEELKEIRQWSCSQWERDLPDAELITYTMLRTLDEEGVVTIEGRDFPVDRLLEIYLEGQVREVMSLTFEKEASASKATREVLRGFSGEENPHESNVYLEVADEDDLFTGRV